MEFLFAYGAGLLTLINPCVVPVLPIVIATAFQANRYGPVALSAGLSLSFVALGVGVTAFGQAVGIDIDTISKVGAGLMVLFGLALLVPQAGAVLAGARLMHRSTRWTGTGCAGSSWVVCFWGPYGARVSVRRWAARFHWRLRARG
jgi:cytochrome c biogenesis protein CcdA